MKRSFWGALLVVSGAALTLSGCNGGTFDELEKAPIALQRDTVLTRGQIAACLIANLSRFGSDLGRFPDVEPGVTRLILGGDESGHFRNYFQIDIADRDGGSHVSLRRSKSDDDSLSLTDMSGIVMRCAQ